MVKQRYRIFEIVQYEKNPVSGEDLHFNEQNIIQGLNYQSIKKYAYILHDKDPINDEEKKLKEKHWHCIIECSDSPQTIESIASWFGVPTQQVEVKKGQGAFLDCVEYITHENPKEQQKGKHLYDDTEVKANFDFRAELTERAERKLKCGKVLSNSEVMLYDVLYNGKTLTQCIEEDRYSYMKNIDKLKKCRLDYISRQEAPSTRLNFYICGTGRIGKGQMAKAIARSLYPQYDNDDDIFFSIGADGASFEGYDGQPVIIWNDFRHYDLLKMLKGRGNVFRVFDTHPENERQNIKYGSINLTNQVNIINSVEPYIEFLDGLVGEYKDKDGELHKAEQAEKAQSYGRFPFIIPIHKDDFSLLLNSGFVGDSDNFLEYIEYTRIRGSMRKIAEACGTNEALKRKIQIKTVKPITDKYNEIREKHEAQELSEEEILKEFENYGEEIHIEDEVIELPFTNEVIKLPLVDIKKIG